MTSLPEKKQPTHFYRNMKTQKETLFYFVRTKVPAMWDLISEQGELIGEFNDRTRMFYMQKGLSNYWIGRIDGEQPVPKRRLRNE